MKTLFFFNSKPIFVYSLNLKNKRKTITNIIQLIIYAVVLMNFL